MPTYQYACTACGHRFEAVQSFSDASLTDCPECAGRLRKVFSAVGIVFKGSGFYRTDSRAGSGDKGSDGSSADSGSSKDGGKDGGAAGKEAAAKKSDSGSASSGSSTSGSSGSSSSSGSSAAKSTVSATASA